MTVPPQFKYGEFDINVVNEDHSQLTLKSGYNPFSEVENHNNYNWIYPTNNKKVFYCLMGNKKDFMVILLKRNGKMASFYHFKDFIPKKPKDFTMKFVRAEVKKEGSK